MFVSRKKYQMMVANYETAFRAAVESSLEVRRLNQELAASRDNFDDVIRLAHEAVAEVDRLKQELARRTAGQFTEEELRTLIGLVHPDRHGGKESAVRMTQKINQLRGK